MTKPISKKFAASCVAEWSGTTGYPDTREGLFCLIETFQKVSKGRSPCAADSRRSPSG